MSSQTAVARPVALKDCQLYKQAEALGAAYSLAMEQDCIRCVQEGIPLPEYLEALEEWAEGGSDVIGYLTECDGLPPDEVIVSETVVGATAVQVNEDEENEKRAAAERAQLKSAEKDLAKCESFVRKAGKSVCENMLNAGKWGSAFVVDKQLIPHDRSSAIKSLDAMLNLLSPVAVDAGQLIASYHAYRLLCEGTELQGATVRYTDYQIHWSRLIFRTTEQRDGKKVDCYVILAGLEERARASFAQLVGNGAPAATVKERVNELLAAHANEVGAAKLKAAQEAKAAKDAIDKAKAEQDAIARATAQEVEAAKAALAQAEQTANVCPADKAAQEAKDKAAQDAKAAQEKLDQENARKAQLAIDQEKARKDQLAKDEAARKAALNVTRANDRLAPRTATGAPGDGPVNPLQRLVKAAAQASPVDVANQALQLLVASSDRHGCFRALLDMVSRSQDMDKRCHRAANNALVSLNAPEPAQS